MKPYLILRLEGPLMAFGRVAVDELRPTGLMPGQAMLTGLLANALGYDHADYRLHQDLQDRLVYGARLDRPGQQLEDFQTAQLDQKEPLWLSGSGGVVFRSGSADSYRGPALRRRYYRADSRVTLALTLEPVEPGPTLDELARALAYPARALYLGRASCPPALPLYRGEIIEAQSPRQALELAPVAAEPGPYQGKVGYAVEYSYEPGLPAEPGRDLVERHDLRQWRNQLHGGLRTVCSGPPVRPPAHNAMPWGLGMESEVKP